MVHIIIAEWGHYRLWRHKSLHLFHFECGLGPLLSNINRFDPGHPIRITLVINDISEHTQYEYLKTKYPSIDTILYRSNIGLDFGAYNTGLHYLRQNNYDGPIIFLNTGVIGPTRAEWLTDYLAFFNERPKTGLVGLSVYNKKKFPIHIQSYFLMSTMAILNHVFPTILPGAQLTKKEDVITNGEIEFSQSIINKGYHLRCIHFPQFTYGSETVNPFPKIDSRFYLNTMHKSYRI